MPFIIEKMEDQFIDAVTNADAWVRRNPQYAGFYESNQELRNIHQEQGTRIKTPEWKHIASLQSPVLDVNMLLQQDFMRDKKKFYSWLDRNPQYCTYDRRRGRRK